MKEPVRGLDMHEVERELLQECRFDLFALA